MNKKTDLDTLCINTIRTLSIDAVEKAKAGHPGMPMGTAPLAYQLWTKHLRHSPENPQWINRDRFVLSAGHGSMLLYSLLHLTGYNLPLEEIKQFRQLNSMTPGHPEYEPDLGVETTTGPLGQGFGNGVGMALAQKYLAAYFNREGFAVIDYTIYGIVSDGDIMEGVQSEAASLAGHLRLDNIIYFYDDNSISIDGETDLSFSEDVGKRYEAYGWNVVHADGNDLASIESALSRCRTDNEGRPSLIVTKTNIGYGSPNKQDTAASHGAALGEDEVRKTKEAYGFDPDKDFFIPEEARTHFRQAIDVGSQLENEWKELLSEYATRYPELYSEFKELEEGKLNIDWKSVLPKFSPDDGKMATRKASGTTLEHIVKESPQIIGGSADLTPSNNTRVSYHEDHSAKNRLGRYIRYGVREHSMGAIMNGMALSHLRPYGGTFLIFSDYMRASLRLAAMMKAPVIYVFTHDSIGLGEDGPTHQPVEHLSSLRAMPNIHVIRPADANETALAWQMALERTDGPTVLALTRQGLPIIDRNKYAPADGVLKGGYVLAGGEQDDMIIIATGSEVQLALEAREKLLEQGISARVVNMACFEVFDNQSDEYRNSVLPPQITGRIAVEAGVSYGWQKYTGINGVHVSLERFGVSAKVNDAMQALGFTADKVVEKALNLQKSGG
ncbi:transketolase [Natronogracilivirga saccharolytica]|uniref:Transketolase n=1 Tax=Natronogracilivirga saccharolytica TaxID=2812953 RepID=A0A8J7RPP3_9BACT|nr:transketolase [Natronogracilivirga saccharolytica]MBP3193878.1 transketolase [Natronogracilivirga saccharolytica]